MNEQGSTQSPDNSSPLLAVLFIGQLITILAIAGLGWMVQNEISTLKTDMKKLASARPAGNNDRQRAPEPPKEIKDWKSLIHAFNVSAGPEDAPVTLIEFSDFQCPFCTRFYTNTYRQLLDEYGDKLRFVYKSLPLEQIHPAAKIAGIGMQCANREGKGWDMHDIMFDNYRSLKKETVIELGKEIGLGDKFVSCVENEETASEVEQDAKDAVKAGARGTPAFLLNGKFLSGAQPLSTFKSEIDAILSN